jgi:hypothetical protein
MRNFSLIVFLLSNGQYEELEPNEESYQACEFCDLTINRGADYFISSLRPVTENRDCSVGKSSRVGKKFFRGCTLI